MDRGRRERSGNDHEQENEQPVVGTAALGDRHDREPRNANLHRHAGAHDRVHDRRQRINDEPRHNAYHQAKHGKEEHRGERNPVRFLGALRRRAARAALERHAERLDEAGGRKRGGERKHRSDRGHEKPEAPGGQLRAEQDGLEGQPFRDKAVERRQGRNRGAADKERKRRLRHDANEPAETLHVALAGCGEHGAGAEEEQALEEGMVEDMQERSRHRKRGGQRHAVRLER